MENSNFSPITASDLMEKNVKSIRYCIDTFLPTGLVVLAGSPKSGKSFFIYDMSIHVANGEPFLGYNVNRSSVLYYALEDSENRLKDRLLGLVEEAPDNLYIATSAPTLEDGLLGQIYSFVENHTDTRLVIIDTLQKIRKNADMSYGNDYSELASIKTLADSLDICILVIHHTRKANDADPFNRILGTNGIAGTADTIFVLDKAPKDTDNAILYCRGRDIEERKLKLKRNHDNGAWDLVSDSQTAPEDFLPQPLMVLLKIMEETEQYHGDNTTLCDKINQHLLRPIQPKALKQLMNRHRDELEKAGLFYEDHRSNGKRYIDIIYIATCDTMDTSVPNDTCDTTDTSVPNGTCGTTDTDGISDTCDMSDILF